MTKVVEVYADCGVVGASRSAIGGPWAFCLVDEMGIRVVERMGVIRPGSHGFPDVTNNQTELFALLRGLATVVEMEGDGWSGKVCTDSLVTIRRVQGFWERGMPMTVPKEWVVRLGAVLRRLGTVEYVNLKGHPNKEQLKAGVTAKGKPVSVHNKWCDDACNKAGALFVASGQARRQVPV
jgi:ribonuclease HI